MERGKRSRDGTGVGDMGFVPSSATAYLHGLRQITSPQLLHLKTRDNDRPVWVA